MEVFAKIIACFHEFVNINIKISKNVNRACVTLEYRQIPVYNTFY